MQIITQKRNSSLTIKAQGRIDTTTATEFGTSISDFIEDSIEEIKELILDFSLIEYVSSVGLRVILELQKKMNNQGSMKIINVNQSVMEVFEMTGFTGILTIE